ncbi:MAG: hypothetical protein ACI87N_003318 [Flavobacteriales bacterium]|jgi:hypothetical protein
MKTPKKPQSRPKVSFRQESTHNHKIVNELVNSRFELKSSTTFRPKKASNSLLFQMYSQENEILFI